MLCVRMRFWWRKTNWWWLIDKSLHIEPSQKKQHFLEYLDCHKSDAWIKAKKISTESSSTNNMFDGDPGCRIYTCSYWEVRVLLSKIKQNNFTLADYTDSDARNNNHTFEMKQYTTKRNRPTETFITIPDLYFA